MNSNNNKKNTQRKKLAGNIQPRKPKPLILLVYILLLGGLGYLWATSGAPDPVKKEWFEVRDEIIRTGTVEKIVFIRNSNRGEVYIKSEYADKYKNVFPAGDQFKNKPYFYFLVSGSFDAEHEFDALLAEMPYEDRFELVMEEHNNNWARAFDWIWLLLMLVLFFTLFMRPMRGMGGGAGGGGIFNVGKSQAKLFEKDQKDKVTFKDVAGLEEAKVEVMEIVDFLKNPKKYTELGGKIPKGALLVGPPGTGKTLLAKAVAGEANVPFFSLSGSDFVEMFVGVGASRVRDLFHQAKEKAPCIVFIDEIDAVGRARSKNIGFSSNDERENTLNQLLTEMDGFGTNSGVIVLAATNRADVLDSALLRAGRFDRQIHVELPELPERLDIFKVHLRGIKLSPEVDIEFLAKQTPGFSGADIANVVNEAALIAARHGKKQVEKQDFLDAVDRIVGGLERKSKIISPEEKNTIAHHEAGHATVSWLLPHANPLLKVTIIPRGQALGAAWYLPEERQLTTKEQMQDELAATIAGRVAEEMINGDVSTGALNDLEKLTKKAYAMVTYFGMSDIVGNVSYYDSTGRSEMSFAKPYSEKKAEEIDLEVKKIIDEAYATATRVLNENRAGFETLAAKLLEKEVIFSDDLETIFGPRKGGVNPNAPAEQKMEQKAEPKPEVKQEPNPEPEPEAKSEPEQEAKPGPEVKPEQTHGVEPESAPEPAAEPAVKPAAEPVDEPSPEPAPEPAVQPAVEP
ncbi:MAG: ATP-dependent zinc metalloprotease FtsH, partial [Bacteroidales bacterium]|nr:ATP-dependent zinc metalloprotease FtsH [Candidatus Equibacterium intestinale]